MPQGVSTSPEPYDQTIEVRFGLSYGDEHCAACNQLPLPRIVVENLRTILMQYMGYMFVGAAGDIRTGVWRDESAPNCQAIDRSIDKAKSGDLKDASDLPPVDIDTGFFEGDESTTYEDALVLDCLTTASCLSSNMEAFRAIVFYLGRLCWQRSVFISVNWRAEYLDIASDSWIRENGWL